MSYLAAVGEPNTAPKAALYTQGMFLALVGFVGIHEIHCPVNLVMKRVREKAWYKVLQNPCTTTLDLRFQ